MPAAFAIYTYFTYLVTRKIPTRPSTPADAALIPDHDAPSFAEVAAGGKPDAQESVVHEEHPHVKPDPDAPVNGASSGSLSKRQKKNRKRLQHDPLGLTHGSDATSDSDAESLGLNKRQKLPRNRPLPKATVPQILNNLVLGTPTPTSRFLNYTAWGINAFVFALALDALLSPIIGMEQSSLAFARIGAVSHSSVKLVARIPPASSLLTAAPIVAGVIPANNSEPAVDVFLPEDEFVGAKVVYRPTKPIGKWMVGPEIRTTEENDWVSTVKIDGLWAATEYECRFFVEDRVFEAGLADIFLHAHRPSPPSLARDFPAPGIPALAILYHFLRPCPDRGRHSERRHALHVRLFVVRQAGLPLDRTEQQVVHQGRERFPQGCRARRCPLHALPRRHDLRGRALVLGCGGQELLQALEAVLCVAAGQEDG